MLSKKGEVLLREFSKTLETNSEAGDATIRIEQYRAELLLNHSVPSIRFMKFEDFAAFGGFLRCPDSEDVTRDLASIDRNNSLLVFISHCWLRGNENAEGWDGDPHPDNASGEKYRLCCEGIKKLKTVFAPRVKDCYIWLDYSCMNQENKDLSDELEHYDRIVEVCDCIFTPIANSDGNAWKDVASDNILSMYSASKWNQGSDAYLNRAWCRVEMLYAAVIPILENDENSGVIRHTMFEGGLAYHCAQNRRPHFLYDFFLQNVDPVLLPPLQHSYFDGFHPLKGHLTVESDIYHIRQLVSDLQRYIDARKITVGYAGETNGAGEPHGRGVMTYDTGEVYEGEWKNGIRHGYGACTTSNGDRYNGNWMNDKINGQGTYYYPDGTVYDGEWKNGERCGHGILTTALGVYEDEWEGDSPSNRGVWRLPNGEVLEGDDLY